MLSTAAKPLQKPFSVSPREINEVDKRSRNWPGGERGTGHITDGVNIINVVSHHHSK
jgi:hypothetical protein